ncbi:hypothetical protein RB614_33335 [Phytohabitans sp. ZYX-F-186]|uniref:Uncharacterized protein n=1 Tax=Phytohabitans maris TaxID=3071409 RepID=A0ABU0ZQW7_9ACTN|nr:hypothetical protein [Phytohabitans sp. ZYX-F-186]MDQ7909418.1 hypothetical protein [Phytohabitans sp. ZYX-F-186]
MKRKTLDLVVSVGGLVLAALLLIAGLVLTSNANFAKNYVADQLGQQNISFKPAAELTEEEKAQPCLVEYAGQKLTTGKQAECYANNFIGLHLKSTADGKTYAELGEPQTQLRTQVAEAEKTNAPNLADLQTQLAQVNQQRDTVFKGETLRGLLLTSYGFSEFGTKAAQFATVAYLAAAALLILAVLGLIHALVTPKTATFAAPEPETKQRVPASA